MVANWTPAVLAKMKSLLAKGLSTAEIGKKIGVSKNAVVGKLNRLGWNAKSMDAPAKKKPIAKPAPKAKATAISVKKSAAKKAAPTTSKAVPQKTIAKGKPAKPAPVAASKSTVAKKSTAGTKSSSKNLAMHKQIIQHSLEMVALKPDQCRYPIGDPDTENFHFCGEKVFVGKPYCYEHCRAAYQFQAPKKKHS